jgi:hypothetical protein
MSSDEAEACHECGTRFPVYKEPNSLPPQDQNELKFSAPLSTAIKWRYLLGACGFVILNAPQNQLPFARWSPSFPPFLPVVCRPPLA